MAIKTPGVYINEENAFPNSIVKVATAVPAFIGYTELAMNGNVPLTDRPTRLCSMMEFTEFFGGPPKPKFAIKPYEKRSGVSPLAPEHAATAPELPQAVFSTKGPHGDEKFELVQINPAYALYGAMQLFFLNGGETCYVTSIGSYDDAIEAQPMLDALNVLRKEADPTLIVTPELTRLSHQEAIKVQQHMLTHCGSQMKNRFAILDIPGGYLELDGPRGQPVERFREAIGRTDLSFGAAYYPWLNTSVFSNDDFNFKNIDIDSRPKLISLLKQSVRNQEDLLQEIDRVGALVLSGDITLSVAPGDTVVLTPADVAATGASTAETHVTFEIEGEPAKMAGKLVTTGTTDGVTEFTRSALKHGEISFVHNPKGGDNGQSRFKIVAKDKNGTETAVYTIHVTTDQNPLLNEDIGDGAEADVPSGRAPLDTVDKTLRASVLYTEILESMTGFANTLPPSAAMAGIYTLVDNSVGVWKAPANMAPNAVVSPTVNIDSAEQETLSASVTGKSINVIRYFEGHSTLVWGAQTLDGNSLDWRYVSVRRTIMMIESSISRAVKDYAFAPNVETTWVAVRSMIKDLLSNLWKEGGLAGATPEDAFNVHLGLGETMTPNDILDGLMNISVKVALLRPFEFIEITFEQEMPKP